MNHPPRDVRPVCQDAGAAAARAQSLSRRFCTFKPQALYQVRRIRCGRVNCWLVTGVQNLPENGSVLIDAGRPQDLPRLEALCREQRVKLLLLTHAHAEHSGCAAALQKNLGIPVALGRADLPLLSKPDGRSAERFTPELLLDGGEDFYRYGFPIRAVALPGHTAGSMGYIVNRQYFCVGGATRPFPFPGAPRRAENPALARESFRRIEQADAALLCPGRGRALRRCALP